MRKVTDSGAFRQWRAANYLEDQDRWLTASPTAEFNFGFIGCGMMGQEHIRNTQLVGGARVAGIFDPASRSVEAALKLCGDEKPRIYGSLDEACNDPDTHALIIATPNYTHLDVLQRVVGAGKAIFVEKPVATSIADAFDACRLLAACNEVVRVGLQYRHKAIYAEAITEVFTRGSVGQVHSVNMSEHRFPFLDKVSQWNKFDEHTGGTLVEKCCHYFDLMNLFAQGRPTRIFATGNQAVNFKDFRYDNRTADGLDQAQVVVDYDNGVIGSFSLTMYAPGAQERLVVCGEGGFLQATESAQLGDEARNELQVWAGENGVSRMCTPTYPGYIARAGHHGSTFFEHVEFIEELRIGQARGPSLSEAFWSVVVGAAAQRSIQDGQAVDVGDVLPGTWAPEVFDR